MSRLSVWMGCVTTTSMYRAGSAGPAWIRKSAIAGPAGLSPRAGRRPISGTACSVAAAHFAPR
eukprot:10257874-Alexandrium_andersonii.AAC.1